MRPIARSLLASTIALASIAAFVIGSVTPSFAASDGIDTPGVVRSGTWYLSNSFGGAGDHTFGFGNPGDIPLSGDWNGDGIDTPGVFRSGVWYLSNGYTGSTDISFGYGNPTDIPVVGDWNGDGIDTVGIVRGDSWQLTDSFGGSPNRVFSFGLSGDKPVVGDWNGDGIDTPGVFRNASWYLSDSFGGTGDHNFVYGLSNDAPVAGDWNGDGIDTIGIVRADSWQLTDSFGGNPNRVFSYGLSGDLPVTGDWDAASDPPPPAITLTRTTDGVSIYQNNMGRFYISDTCHTNGTSTDPGATIGPGYIYRVDVGAREVAAPIPSNGAVLNPPSGLGVYMADLYQGDPNNTPYTDNSGNPQTPPNSGRFESVQGNVCLGDLNNLAYTAGSGVSSSSTDDKGTLTSAPSGSYLWVHYTVNLSDPYGQQFAVLYWYRFYANEVDLWTKVTPCPGGTCHPGLGGTAPFIKMPKFEYAVTAQGMDYRTVSCYDLSGTKLHDAGQTTFPNISTTSNHCDGNSRGRMDIWNSASGVPPFRITGKSQPSAQTSFGPSYATYPWESPGTTGYGIDKWGAVGQNRTHLIYSPTLNTDNQCGAPAGTAVHSYDDNMRKWEMGGDDPSVPPSGGGKHYYPYKTLYAMFKGWEDGNGPPDCRSLYNNMVNNEAYANFFRLTN